MTADLTRVRGCGRARAASRGLGMEAQVVEVDRARVRITVTESMVNSHDLGHGGFIFSLADSTFALACDCRGRLTVAAGADITFVSAARRGDVLIAEGRVRATYGAQRDHRRHGDARVRRRAGRGVPRRCRSLPTGPTDRDQ